jgi:hypothetical protein
LLPLSSSSAPFASPSSSDAAAGAELDAKMLADVDDADVGVLHRGAGSCGKKKNRFFSER